MAAKKSVKSRCDNRLKLSLWGEGAKRMRQYSIVIVLMLFGAFQALAATNPILMPTPQKVSWGSGRFVVRHNEPVQTTTPEAISDFSSYFDKVTSGSHPIRSSARIHFDLLSSRNTQIGDQGYLLTVTPSEITVKANTPQGLFYGSQTLRELLVKNGGVAYFPSVSITDWPAMGYRGVMVDISRGLVPNTATFERLIRGLARMKINAVQPYIEDTFAFKKYPFIGRDRGAWTPQEVAKMVKVAKAYYVDMSPCFESLGHMYQILKHPEMADLRETMDVISPAKPGTYTFLNNCYTELAKAFPFPYLNVGCDETFDLGKGPSKALVAKEGLGKVYADHMMKLDQLCQEHHKTMQFWGDMMLRYPGIVGDMPKDAIVMNWDYGDQTQFPTIATYKSYGYKQIVCPGIESWGDMFPDVNFAKGNIRGFIQAGKAANVIGVLNTCWRDNGEVFYDYDWFPDAIGAEFSWASKPVVGKTFDEGFDRCFYGIGGDDLAQAFRILGDSLSAFPGAPANQTLQYYYANPFSDLSIAFTKNGKAGMAKLVSMAHQIRNLTDHARPTDGEETFLYLQYGADRIAFIAQKYDMAKQIAETYNSAYSNSSNKDEATRHIKRAIQLLDKLNQETVLMRDRYSALWNLENHPQGLSNVQGKYDGSLTAYVNLTQQLRNALTDIATGKPLPSPATLGLVLPQSTSSGYRRPSSMAKNPSWSLHSIYAIRVALSEPLQTPIPAQILVKSNELPENLPLVTQIRLMDQSDTTVSELPCQVNHLNNKETLLTFIIPSGLGGNLDFALDNTPARVENPITLSNATQIKGGMWIDNSKYRALLGKEGAHIYRFDVAALKGRDVTMPGDTQWHGFDDVGSERETTFTLQPILKGPLCVQIDCKASDGFDKLLSFFDGTGWYETRFGEPVSFFWNYDDPAVMGSSSPTPGQYRYADGKTGPLPQEGDMSIADQAPWVAKYRSDGFTLGLVSPQGDATLRAGPGDGMGGVGVEGGGSTSNLLTYANVTPKTWNTVASLYQSWKAWEKASISARAIR